VETNKHDAKVDSDEPIPLLPIENLIVDLFISAKPEEQPEVAQYAYGRAQADCNMVDVLSLDQV